MRLLDRLRKMGLLDRRSSERPVTHEPSEAVKQSATQVSQTMRLVDELTRLEMSLVPHRKR